MKNPPLHVGVIIPPDDHYKPVLYSDYEATNRFRMINSDIYEGVKKSSKPDRYKTPLLVKIIAGVGVAFAGFFGLKKLIRR